MSQWNSTDPRWYAWYLVCEILYPRGRSDLVSLCLVSKTVNNAAIPFLYRSINVEVSENLLVESRDRLAHRLFDASHESPQCFVKEITVSAPDKMVMIGRGRRRLSALIKRLPNLRCVRFKMPCDFKMRYMSSIEEHPNKPQLHLLAESGLISCPRSLPAVTAFRVKDDSDYDGDKGPNYFLSYIASYPNLKSVIWKRRDYFYRPYRVSGFDMDNIFRSLEHLALDGHILSNGIWDWPHGPFNLSNLSSLELGPDWMSASSNLSLLTGHMVNLRRLKVRTKLWETRQLCQPLINFLLSFDTLVDLTIINLFVSFHAITGHTGLVNLRVHEEETRRSGYASHMPGKQDLISLDVSCPHLETLELDVERVSNGWPTEVLETFASRFPNMKILSLHFTIDYWRHNLTESERLQFDGAADDFFKLYSTYKEAREIGALFYAIRHEVFKKSPECVEMVGGLGRLRKLTLSVGTGRGCPHQRLNSIFEETQLPNTFNFDVLPPKTVGEVPRLVHRERELAEQFYQSSPNAQLQNYLQDLIMVAEEGPRRVKSLSMRGAGIIPLARMRASRLAHMGSL